VIKIEPDLIILLSSLGLNCLAFFEFWVFWYFAKKQFYGLRNYFMRNSGWGYLVILYPEGRIKKVFTKFKDSMKHKKEQYTMKAERVHYFEGLPSLFYNKGDHTPIDFKALKKEELWSNAQWLDNLFSNTKAAAEAEAEAKNSLNQLLLWLCILIGICSVGGIAYLIYMLQETGVVINAVA